MDKAFDHHELTGGRAVGRSTRRWRPTRFVVFGALAALVGLGLTSCRETKDKPVLLVHGWSATGGSNCGDFDSMISQMRADGFTGQIVRVGYYTGDTNCDMTLRDWGSFSNSSSWKDVAKAFSNYVNTTYTSQNVTVDAVGYSMGGLIVRGGVYGSAIGESGFTTPIDIEDAVTFGAPFNGAAWYSSFCLWGQCSTMKPGAADIGWLNQEGNPQGLHGTEWTAFGSDADSVTPVDSALDISVPDARKVHLTDVPHTGDTNYMHTTSVVTRAELALEKVDQ